MRPAAIDATPALFEALIVPHRSLSRRGTAILCAAMVAVAAAMSLRFWFIGAWPVAGFTVVEIALALGLFRLNASRARQSELLLLSEATLRVVRTDWRGRRTEQSLPTAWLRLRLEERPATVARLLLCDRAASVEVGRTLGDAEKRDLAEALEAAIHRARNPRFDNPQLRDEA